MQSPSVVENGGRLAVTAPYDAGFVAQAKLLGGKWDPRARTWTFDARDSARLADLLEAVYGYTPEVDSEPTVSVRIDASAWGESQAITLLGRKLAERRGRDDEVRLADGVVCVSGRFANRAGSARYPIIGTNDAVLEARDVPVSVGRRMAASASGVAILDDSDAARRADLLARRERLVAELATVDAELAALDATAVGSRA
jgi:hypothetical protein